MQEFANVIYKFALLYFLYSIASGNDDRFILFFMLIIGSAAAGFSAYRKIRIEK